MYLLLLASVLFCAASSTPIGIKAPQSCQACHPADSKLINVHLVPHSHDDVGWLKTVDQYFYGSFPEIQRFGVQFIISSVIEALRVDPNRRYVQVETAFFWKWWQRQPDFIRQEVIDLVNSGQLEITSAAWSMNDEAGTNYQSIIDQFTLGLRTINETLGVCGAPTIGWQIDPFGHSREQASIFSQLGYDAEFFARIDYNDFETKRMQQDLEVVWKGSANLDNSDIFTVVFPEGYGSLNGFCYDILCNDEVFNDDQSSPEYNVPDIVGRFEARLDDLTKNYRTNNIIIPMGTDFQFQSAEKNFQNLDKLIAGFADHDRYRVFYSTPSCYVRAVNEVASEQGVNFTVKTDDFLPYGSGPHTYWTGYFTSRPNLKRNERLGNNILQAAKQLASFSKINGADHEADLTYLKQAVGILQHHDAITGTSKENVAQDYIRLWSKGIEKVEPALGDIILNLLKKDDASDVNLDLHTCLLANVSVCEIAQSSRFVVSVYNPLERNITHYVRLPTIAGRYRVSGPNGEIPNDVTDTIASFSYVDHTFGTPSPKELVFPATLSGFEVALFYVERTGTMVEPTKTKQNLKFGSDSTGFEIDAETGLLKLVTINGVTLEIKQEFLYYNGFSGSNSNEEEQSSGAYIFRPQENVANIISENVEISSTSTQYVDEIRQEVNGWITQIIRVYKGDGDNYIEFDWLIGPIDLDDVMGGKEIISRFTVNNFNNNQTFYTDSNGREMMKRQLNQRNDYTYDATVEPIASNYYPVTSKIVIKDMQQNLEVAVLTDRAQGGSSLDNGVIELMVHRRLLADDSKGVGEALDDTEFNQGVVTRGQHYLVIGSANSNVESGKSTAAQERELALKKLLAPLVLIGDASSDDLSLDNLQQVLNFNKAILNSNLPDNVHVLTLEPWQNDGLLLRLEHILENNEDDTLSQTVVVNLADLFGVLNVVEIRETTLGANHWLDEFQSKKRLVWNNKTGTRNVDSKKLLSVTADDLVVTLDPMQIRTFVIRLQ